MRAPRKPPTGIAARYPAINRNANHDGGFDVIRGPIKRTAVERKKENNVADVDVATTKTPARLTLLMHTITTPVTTERNHNGRMNKNGIVSPIVPYLRF
jgi:hypothetical protein